MKFLPFVLIRHGGFSHEALPKCSGRLGELLAQSEETVSGLQDARTKLLAVMDQLLDQLDESLARTELYNQRKRLYQGRDLQWLRLKAYQNKESALQACFDELEQWKYKLDQQEKELAEIWENEYQLAKQAVMHFLIQNDQFKRGLVATGSDVASIKPSIEDDKYCRALYAYLTRATVKTSPLSTLGTVDFLHLKFGAPMPWEEAVERFFPSMQMREPLYWALDASDTWAAALPFRLNPSISKADATRYTWIKSDEDGETIESAEADEELEAMLNLGSELGARPLKEWENRLFEVIDPEFLQDAVDLQLLQPVMPEPGLEGGWAKRLMNYLAMLGAGAPQTEITMLNLLTKASTQFPHMNATALNAGMEEVKAQLVSIGKASEFDISFLKATDLYSHDVHIKRSTDLQIADTEPLATKIGSILRQLPGIPLDQEHVRMRTYARSCENQVVRLPNGETAWPFIHFAFSYLSEQRKFAKQKTEEPNYAPWQGKWPISAVLQGYYNEQGIFSGVLNGLSPGGGRISGRFLNMFPEQILTEIQAFNAGFMQDGCLPVAFRQITPTNANLHPTLTAHHIDWPGKLGGTVGQGAIPISDIGVRLNHSDMLELVRICTGQTIKLFEFGLEARHEKSRLAQLLLSIGIPNWSTALWATQPVLLAEDALFSQRISAENGQIVLQRAAWDVEIPSTWAKLDTLSFYRALAQLGNRLQLPDQVFYTYGEQRKPQYLHRFEPFSVEVLRANLAKSRAKRITFTEMLPLPHQSATAGFAAEFVLEFQL